MKNKQIVLLTLTLVTAMAPRLSTVLAQGSLTPPGAPAPTMKSLAQIEPRTPISSLPYTITSAGAYFLTTNLTGVSGTNGITIAANDVSLDLKGFSLLAVPGANAAIRVSGNRTNLWLGSGTIRGWGLDGIDAGSAQFGVFIDLNIIGCGNTGFRPGTASVITRCAANANAQEGFLAYEGCAFSQCTASHNGAAGISTGNNCRITDCRAQFNGYDGIAAGAGCSISGCTSGNNTNSGISSLAGGAISSCTVEGNLVRGIDAGVSSSVVGCAAVGMISGAFIGRYGILVGDGSVVKDCTSRNNSFGTDSSGIRAGNNCTLSGCAVATNSPYGIFTGSNCVVLACSSSGNVSGLGTGIVPGQCSTVRDSAASGNYVGISVTASNTTVEGCVASGNGSVGIFISADGCLILNNTCDGNGAGGGYGIECNGSYNRVEGNHLANNNNTGILVISSALSLHNVVTRNSALTNAVQTVGYNIIASTSDVGPIGKAATATSPWANLQ